MGVAVVVTGVGIAGAAPASAVDCNAPAAPGVDWSGCNQTGKGLNLANVDLSGANLSDTTLNGLDFSGANLAGANLTDATFGDANLAGANLSRASAQGADFFRADMAGANLTAIDLTGGFTKGTTLTGANLTGANLTGVFMGGSDLTDAFVDCGTGGVLGTSIAVGSDPDPVLPSTWTFVAGTLTATVVACPPAATIPAWVQAYGREGAKAACLDGWDASWQAWAEPVTGGWVCTRSIPSLG
jgi:hypothetical protein